MGEQASYEYELRDGDEVIATGRITVEEPPTTGDRIAIGKRAGMVVELLPAFGDRDRRVILQIAT
jgi:hypothetical protein